MRHDTTLDAAAFEDDAVFSKVKASLSILSFAKEAVWAGVEESLVPLTEGLDADRASPSAAWQAMGWLLLGTQALARAVALEEATSTIAGHLRGVTSGRMSMRVMLPLGFALTIPLTKGVMANGR